MNFSHNSRRKLQHFVIDAISVIFMAFIIPINFFVHLCVAFQDTAYDARHEWESRKKWKIPDDVQ